MTIQPLLRANALVVHLFVAANGDHRATDLRYSHSVWRHARHDDSRDLEFEGDAGNVADATARLEEFIVSLNIRLGELINQGYPHTLLGRAH